MSNIKMSPKHGVNPTIPVCFFCGKEKNEIAFLGKLKGDVAAPKSTVLNYEPCDDCKKIFSKGVLFIGVVTEAPDNRPPIQKDGEMYLYPTGAYIVGTEDFVNRIFEKTVAESLLKSKKCLIPQGELSVLQQQYASVCGENNE